MNKNKTNNKAVDKAVDRKTLPISLEFFPPKTDAGAEKLVRVREKLYALNPEFFSVTYGAGGSTQAGTLDLVNAIRADGYDAAPHFSCIGATRDKVREQLQEFQDAGIKRIVALRGDLPSGHGSYGDFRYASDLVEFIREETGEHFHIKVACYPETHPQSRCPQSDLDAFETKVRAGADAAITQYFFNCDAYFRFVDECAQRNLDVPVIPGIMPILNSSQLMRFSDMCGAEIPRWIRLRLQAFGDDRASIRAFGLDVMTELCEQLLAQDIPAIHFYTMNQSVATLELCERLGLGGK